MKINKNKLLVILSSIIIAINISSCNNGHSSSQSNSFFNMFSGSSSKVNATSQSWNYTYNSKHLLETSTDPNGNVTNYEYDSQGHLTKIINPLKQSITFSDFERHGQPQTIVDQNGVKTKLTYTSDGWILNSTTDGSTTRFDHDQVGNINRITFADNTSLLFVYDGANYLTEIQGMDGLIKYTRDAAENIKKISVGGTRGIVYYEDFIYDEMNRLTMDWGENSNKLRMYSYDNDNNIIKFYKEGVGYTDYSYDSLQRLANSTTSDGDITAYEYNNLANLNNPSAIIDARNNKTIYTYNGISNLLKLVSPDSGTHTNTAYDGNGNLLSQVDARGEQISYSYDALNRPKEINYASDNRLDTLFTYDNGTNGIGRLTKVQNGVSTNTYSYDARGNTLTETQRVNNSDYTLKYGYDKVNNLTNIVYPSNTQVVYSYSDGRVARVTVNGKTVADISHLPFGPITQINYGNNVQEKIIYNTNYIQTGYQLENGSLNREYKIVNGNINAISGIGSFFYDRQSRLNLFMNEDYTYMQFYNYDQLGNRTSYSEYGSDDNVEYNIATNSNRIVSKTVLNEDDVPISTTNYLYDNAGNMVKSGSNNYIYNSLNQLQTVTTDDLKNSKTISEYQYNAFSQRIMKTVNGNKTIFIYNSAGQLLEERDLQTNVVRDYIYIDGKLIAAVENGMIIYIVTDHLNAPQIVMDSSGRQVWKADYDPFGRAIISGYYKLNLRADGQYQDDETGLYYNWYRYYDPSLGRYITSDPLGLAAGMNTYIYVNGNPVNYTDPMGLFNVPAAAAGSILIGIVANAGIEAYIEKSQTGKYNPKNLAIAGGAGAIAGEVGAATDLIEMGFIEYAAYNLGANGLAGGVQRATQNMCDGKRVYDGVAGDALSAMQYEALGLGFHAGSLYVGGTIAGSYAVGATAIQRYQSGQKLIVKNPYKQVFTQSRQNADQIGLILETIVPTQTQINQSNQ